MCDNLGLAMLPLFSELLERIMGSYPELRSETTHDP